jgi:putative flippase GtrA
MSMAAALLRHQAGSFAATTLDFTTMVALVSGLGLPPPIGTAIGAACGGTLNFILGRRWIFRATHRHPAPQAGRYALVSFSSLLLNTGGEHLVADLLHVQYVAARACVAIAVGIFWNFPMQRHFVFGGGSLGAQRRASRALGRGEGGGTS